MLRARRSRGGAAAYEVALGEAKQLIVALDCVEIDQLAPTAEIAAAHGFDDTPRIDVPRAPPVAMLRP